MNFPGSLKTLCYLLLFTLTACGGGGGGSSAGTGGGGGTPLQTLTMQESQRYFPLNDGNLWVSQEQDTFNGAVTASFTRVSQRAGSKLVGGVVSSVISVTELPFGTVYENYLIKDTSGITANGSNAVSNPSPAAIGSYRLVSFPIQIGAAFRQIDKKGIDYGWDLDGDGINEKLDITADVVVRGIEAVTTAAGSFPSCLRLETTVTETMTYSGNGARITATGVETTWYAQDIGPVKMVTSISGNGQSSQTTEDLTGYLVDGHSSRLSLQVTPATATINAGATTQFSATLLDATNNALITIPATWASSDTSVATVDATGLATGVKAGTATITPWVGGVAGPSATLAVQFVAFKAGAGYPGPASIPSFACGNSALGDLNGDGRNDVVVMESNGGSRILVYYQNSAGTLDAPQVITTTLSLRGIAIRDVNNDGLADLVVSGNSTTASSGWLGRVVVYRQNPTTHTFDSPQEYTLSTNTAGALAIADLNSDGLPDIVVSSAGSSGNGLISFLFQGTGGSLGTEYVYTAVPIVAGGEIHVADMNSDGRNDIVVQSGYKQLAVIKQLSPGIFSTTPDFYTVTTSYWPYFSSFALGDLNGDGRVDIAVADPGNSGNVNMFLQNSTGTLSGPSLLQFSFNVQDEVKIADMDGDGLNDIIILSYGNVVQILLQPSTHIFKNVQTFSLPTLSEGGTVVHQAMSIGDVTGDGLPDVVASWSNEGVFVLPRR